MSTAPAPFRIACDPQTGLVTSCQLYGTELLDTAHPAGGELLLNGLPFAMRAAPRPELDRGPLETRARLQGERFVNHYAGMGLVLTRNIGTRPSLPHPAVGIAYGLQRETAPLSYHCPGPGGPTLEAPMYVDALTLLNWNWRFWGDDTRMIFPNSYSAGPDQENGHVGYEHATPEAAKRFMGHIFRRLYPGGMVFHGAVYYNVKTGHWLAITCRRPHLGYTLNIQDAGRGVCFDFTLHAELKLGTTLRLPEITLYHGETADSMQRWMADYATFYYQEPPAWTQRTLWGPGVAWDMAATWAEQGKRWEQQLDRQEFNGLWISLVTQRIMLTGTSPTGYGPDPRHGTREEFRQMCRRLADRGVPLVIWMSHSGLVPGALEVDDDWFIRGADDRLIASWGNTDADSMCFVNPGHPGYIAYTKKWLSFYIKECGAKAIFFDCLGHPIPPDFRPRPWMRFPGDAPVHAIPFMEEMYAWIKQCDPEAIMVGEGTSLDGPVEMFSVVSNPPRGLDGYGPRDFLLSLNTHAPKQLSIYASLAWAPSSGYSQADFRPGKEAHNQYLLKLLQARGARTTFKWAPGDLSIMDDLVIVPSPCDLPVDYRFPQVRLPAPWDATTVLREELTGATLTRAADGLFHDVPPGFYRMR